MTQSPAKPTPTSAAEACPATPADATAPAPADAASGADIADCATQPDGTPVARPGECLSLRLHVSAWGGYAWSVPGMAGATVTDGFPHGWRPSGESHPHCCLDWSVLTRITPVPAATYTVEWTVPEDTPAGLLSFPVNGGRVIDGRGVTETIGHLHIEVAAEPAAPGPELGGGLVNRDPRQPVRRTVDVDESFDVHALVGNEGPGDLPAESVNLTFEIVDESRVGIASLATFTVLLVTNQGRYEFTAQERSRTRIRCARFNKKPLAAGDTHRACLVEARALTGARPGDTFTVRTSVDTGESAPSDGIAGIIDALGATATAPDPTARATVRDWHFTVK